MKLIVGGAFQGKRDFAFRLTEKEPGCALLADGETDSLELALQCDILCGFQEYVRRFFMDEENGMQRLREFIDRLIAENPGVIVTANELGCGIVPVEKRDRILRERSGDACRLLAGFSDEVYRVICGLPVLIKSAGGGNAGGRVENGIGGSRKGGVR